jgi:23S rRNA (uridine2479-2'-O)-methyltransferase
MKTVNIYSKNAAYQKFEVLKTNRNKRHRYGEFFVEGVRNLNGAIRYGWAISALLYTPDLSLSRWAEDFLKTAGVQTLYALAAGLMTELSGKSDTSELLAVVRMREDSLSALPTPERPLYALFDRPSNKGNLGAVIRSCDAIGVDGIILTGHAVDMYDPEVIAASMGSFFRVPVIRVPDTERAFQWISHMRERYPAFQAVGTTAHRETNISELDLRRPTLLMIGNEADGLSRALKENCDMLATIPMAENASASSLNVACAATVLFYEAARQRRGATAQAQETGRRINTEGEE